MPASHSIGKPEFRNDINGLRAWAVIVVILYHFGIPGFRGGFVGVDVFFVISGFLMTNIIVEALANDRFSVSKFYLARARRIAPALLALCAVLLFVGWFTLPPVDYEILGTHAIYSLLFLSNMKFWSEAGYFEVASHEKWLLHTWSLSVEWQFYLLLPLVLLAIWKVRPGLATARVAIATGFVASLGVSLIGSLLDRNTAFFMLHTRAWELFAGGLVYLFAPYWRIGRAKTMEAIGFGLIIVAVMTLNARSEWPGWRTLLPVAGAALVLLAARPQSLLTNNPLAQWMGTCSYSLYLWHWPIFVGLAYVGLQKDPKALAIGLLMTFVLGHVSYSLIESKARTWLGRFRPRAVAALLAATTLSVSALGMNVAMQGGIPARVDAESRRITDEMVMPLITNGWCFYSIDTIDSLRIGADGLKCTMGSRNASTQGLLFGDSYAGHYGPFWDTVARSSDIRINSVATNWCYPSLTKEFTGPLSSRAYAQCLLNREYLKDRIDGYDFVVFAGSWRSIQEEKQLQGVLDAIAFAASRSKLVVVMAAPTSFDVNISKKYQERILLGLDFNIADFGKRSDRKTRDANQRIEAHARNFANVMYLDRDALFNIDGRPSDLTTDNAPFSLDGSHISVYGAKMAAAAFLKTGVYVDFRKRLAEVKRQAPLNVAAGASGPH